ncbi:MAG: ABC transporter permease subunit [Planctomycetaceae bacterium]|nr:ABC transporter permease subunit [Planctomycetaceae bacterium]
MATKVRTGSALAGTLAVFRREFAGYFATPVAAVFLVVFLLLCGVLTFNQAGFYERGQADLLPFFTWHPWLYLFLVPALAMRLWSEERRQGTIELLLTLPLATWQATLGKFLAAWCFAGLALALTLPYWITVSWLGSPDHGVIAASYLGSFLLAGGYLAIGAFVSALTKNQVIAFVLSVLACFLLVLAGYPTVLEFFGAWAPDALVEAVRSLSFLTHFEALSRGVVDARGIVFFLSAMACFLIAGTAAVELEKAR